MVEDYKTKVREAQDEIKELKIQNKSLTIDKINTGIAEDVEGDTFADDSDEESNSQFQEKKMEIKELLTNNPTKATEELYRLWLATTKEYKIVKKDKAKLEDKFEELKTDIAEMKQDDRVNVQKMLELNVKVIEKEKENESLNSALKSLKEQPKLSEQQESEKNQKLQELTEELKMKKSEIEKLTKKFQDTTEAHRNLKTKEKKLETASGEIKAELEELKRKYDSNKMELEMTKSNNENDLNRLVEQRKELEDERDELNKK